MTKQQQEFIQGKKFMFVGLNSKTLVDGYKDIIKDNNGTFVTTFKNDLDYIVRINPDYYTDAIDKAANYDNIKVITLNQFQRASSGQTIRVRTPTPKSKTPSPRSVSPSSIRFSPSPRKW